MAASHSMQVGLHSLAKVEPSSSLMGRIPRLSWYVDPHNSIIGRQKTFILNSLQVQCCAAAPSTSLKHVPDAESARHIFRVFTALLWAVAFSVQHVEKIVPGLFSPESNIQGVITTERQDLLQLPW